MQIWTTFCPQKVAWELACAASKGKKSDSNWFTEYALITESLKILKDHGIAGIRLVIFPEDIVKNKNRYDFLPVKKLLATCHKLDLLVDFCLGPYQYPHYPGIFLPNFMTKNLAHETEIDKDKKVYAYGIDFLTKQLNELGNDKNIRGFYLGNEWPDYQRVSNKEELRVGISKHFMLEAANLCKILTSKLISLNTNIDPSFTRQCINTYNPLLKILGKQGRLGLDVYPSQETWKKAPHIKAQRLLRTYSSSVASLKKQVEPSKLFFAEVEAQPWGGGQSWHQLITLAANSHEEIYGFSNTSFSKIMNEYICPTKIDEVSLWGSDFWLIAHVMQVTWPIQIVKKLAYRK